MQYVSSFGAALGINLNPSLIEWWWILTPIALLAGVAYWLHRSIKAVEQEWDDPGRND